MSTTAAASPPVLADLLPGALRRDVALVVAGLALLVVAGQITIPLWFTPVPLSLATFAVVLTGAACGPWRAGASTLAYLALGAAGAPVFADRASGWSFPSFGYVVGYVGAAMLVGFLARRRTDRHALATFASACAGTLVVYAVGLPWLMADLGVDLSTGLRLGVTPFLVGDAVKAAAAAVLLPTVRRVVDPR